jgi:hypothetical protein
MPRFGRVRRAPAPSVSANGKGPHVERLGVSEPLRYPKPGMTCIVNLYEQIASD